MRQLSPRRRHIVTLAAAAATFMLWQLGILEPVVLVLAGVAAGASVLCLVTGCLSARIAIARAAGWLERRLQS